VHRFVKLSFIQLEDLNGRGCWVTAVLEAKLYYNLNAQEERFSSNFMNLVSIHQYFLEQLFNYFQKLHAFSMKDL